MTSRGAAVSGAKTGAAVEAVDVRKRYGERTVLEGVTFSVARGEVFALLGPNGAGKTTTVEILEGYHAADGGTVRVLGLDPVADGGRLRPRMGLMLQEGGVDPRTTPVEAVRLYASLFAHPAEPDALLELVGIEGRVRTTRYRRLSGGEKQRLGLALALVGRPELLVLDEPTAGMDPAARQVTRRLIGEVRAAGATILLTTHDLGDVEALADHVAVLDRGRIVALGTPAELTGSGRPRVAIRFAPASVAALADGHDVVLRERLLTALTAVDPSLTVTPSRADTWEVAGAAVTPSLIAFVAAWAAAEDLLIADLRAGAGSLEERYLELVGPAATADVRADDAQAEAGGTP